MRKSSLFLLIIFLLSLVSLVYFWLFYPQKRATEYQVDLFPLDSIPVLKDEALAYEDLALSAASAYALDLDSMTVLYEKDSQAVLYPASTSKMMTALVALDTFPLEKDLLVTNEATISGNKLEIQEGQIIKVKDLVASMLIFSANDSAFVLANNDPASFSGFMQKMNDRASMLGLTQTHFSNPAGLDEDGQKSTARDLTLIAKELLKNDQLKQLVATPYKKIEGADWSYDLYNSNQLLGKIQGVYGVKTGTTELAGEVLVTLIKRDGHQILITLMNSKDRYEDTSRLIAWILNNYEWKKL